MMKPQAINTYMRPSQRATPKWLPEQAMRMRTRLNLLLLMPPMPMADALLAQLKQAGYTVHRSYTADEAQCLLQREEFDLILFYLVQAGSDTFDLCVSVRSHNHIPLMMLADEKSLRDMCYGLAIGAVAYVPMPCAFPDLDQRIQTTWRTTGKEKYRYLPNKLAATPFSLNADKQSVKMHGQEIPLTQIEYQILQYLTTHPQTPVSKQQLAQIIWGFIEEQDFNFIEVAMWRLRKKIEVDPTAPQYLITVRGVGYQLNLPPNEMGKSPEKMAEKVPERLAEIRLAA